VRSQNRYANFTQSESASTEIDVGGTESATGTGSVNISSNVVKSSHTARMDIKDEFVSQSENSYVLDSSN